jgi:cell division septum initiation protein DivIVA
MWPPSSTANGVFLQDFGIERVFKELAENNAEEGWRKATQAAADLEQTAADLEQTAADLEKTKAALAQAMAILSKRKEALRQANAAAAEAQDALAKAQAHEQVLVGSSSTVVND